MSSLHFLRQNAPWLSAGMILTFLSSFGQTFFISIFAGEIQATFDLSHGQWGGIYSLGTTASAILMVWAGGLTDQFRVRTLGPAILALMICACLFMALNPVWWLLPFVVFSLRFTGQGMTSHIATVAMSRWFIATRGRALSIATLGFAVGEAILPVVFVMLMTVIDWRILWVVAAVIAGTGIPILLHLLRTERTPQHLAQTEQTAGMEGRHWTRNETLRHWLFWYMCPALLGPAAFSTTFFFHQVHFANTKGISHIELVAMFPIYTVVGIITMLGSGWALDRFGTRRLMPYYQLPMVAGFALFAMASGPWTLLAGFIFLAMTAGANTTLPNAFWAEFYGTRNLGSIKAMAAAIIVLGSAIGPGLTGLAIDAGIGIETQYYFVAAFFIFVTVMMRSGIIRAKALL